MRITHSEKKEHEEQNEERTWELEENSEGSGWV
jgi:hypothetical protein